MKNSIILGIALVTFTNALSAANVRQSFTQDDFKAAQTFQLDQEAILASSDIDAKDSVNTEDPTIIHMETLAFTSYEKTIEEIIAENNQITESSISNEMTFLFIEKSIEEVIAEDNKIIDSTPVTEVSLLFIERPIEEIIAEDNRIIESTISSEAKPLSL
ncbi:hypothetical protein [Flavobacterium sp. GT3R68]|uniref:hypothetical protein n=1 Tax=Flavobacterium sp. GT3R68 TaxID=2594437 RepID=UPI000F876DF3|nr:hypothetical protein [Flavobacterium sp. GT3R68]RTY90579.1 hypothetical protein EKL32_20370 [Flavobacterium sp. GSN2]TRW89895.1 hypothetical protein FNW07_12695 [Flavobacterium sp. GT3R68]